MRRSCWSTREKSARSAGDAPRPLALRHSRRRSARIEAADGNFEACNALFAGHGGSAAAADGVDEGEQLGAQRLGVADRQMAHRIAAVRLKAETLGDLQGEQVADQVFVAGRDVDGARLERGEPV